MKKRIGKINVSMIFFLLYSIIGYSYTSVISIDGLGRFYKNCLVNIPLFRYINSKEGLGYEYIFNVLSETLSCQKEDLEDLLESRVTFYSDFEYNYSAFLEPDIIKNLSNIILRSNAIYIENRDVKTISDIVENIFNGTVVKGGYDIYGREYRISYDENGVFLNKPQSIYIPTKEYPVEGKIKGFMNDGKNWDFHLEIKDKALKGSFISRDYSNDMQEFDISLLENRRIFGDIQTYEVLQKGRTVQYIQEFFVPYDKNSVEIFNKLFSDPKDEQFVVIRSESLTDSKMRSIYFSTVFDTKNINALIKLYNLGSGKIGTYDYCLISHKSVGDKIYFYYSQEGSIVSTVSPDNMKIYLSESPRLKSIAGYKMIERKKLERFVFADLERYFEENFFSSIPAFLSATFFKNEDKNYCINIILK
jgi:hypothetical protein